MTQQKTIDLSRGTLQLTYQTVGDYQLDDLLDFAERINPKRAFLFVSKVLGRHIPVSPYKMRQAFGDLAALIPDNLPQPIVVVGMAETAVGLSAGVHACLQARYPTAILLNSTRHAQPAALLTTFSEDHSHAQQHLIYQSDDPLLQQAVMSAKTLIMVDDEASTGKTCQNVVNALYQAGMQALQQVHLATLVDWSLGNAPPNLFAQLDFFRHHLLSGHWQWTNRPHAKAIAMPDVATTAAGSQPLGNTGNWGRLPTTDSTSGLTGLLTSLEHQRKQHALEDWAGKKVLVLGSNEFVWLPFLLAETLAQQGAAVKFSALTRSPIAPQAQSGVTSVIQFYDNYGLGMTNFAYNVIPTAWDWIVLCVETPSASVDAVWRDLPNLLVVAPRDVSPLI
ncbi:MAG: phosphoribosyltransferase domain-containing protein [Moraxella sp.]